MMLKIEPIQVLLMQCLKEEYLNSLATFHIWEELSSKSSPLIRREVSQDKDISVRK